MSRPVAIVGYGGHARVLHAALRAAGRSVVAATSLEISGNEDCGIEVMTDPELKERFSPADIDLALGLGTIRSDSVDGVRKRLATSFIHSGYAFVGVVHPFSCVCQDSDVSALAQVFAGAVVQAGAKVGEFTILNTGCSVDHDCVVGNFCHIAPGATLSGNVEIGDFAHVGTGANVIQGIRVGTGATVAAGATVIGDVPDYAVVAGTPARILSTR